MYIEASLQHQLVALCAVFQRRGIQLAEIDDLPVVRMVTDHKGFGKIAGDIQHHALIFRRRQIISRPLAGGAFVQTEKADNMAIGHNFILS